MTASLKKIAQRALSSYETVEASYYMATMAIGMNIPGDFVECGVFAGSQVAAMASCLMHHGVTDRKIHLFDSFLGIPQAGPHDVEFLEAGHQEGLSACSVEEVQANMREWCIDDSLLTYHVGPFERTLAHLELRHQIPMGDYDPAYRGIAILRMDGDLYESTKVCMENLYPLVSPGGIVIVDDFGLSGARKAVTEYMDDGKGFPPVYWRKA